MVRSIRRFHVGKDFSEEDLLKWQEQLAWWIKETSVNVDDPVARAKRVLIAAMNGTKINGEPWLNVNDNFYSRVRQLAGFDLERGVGVRRGRTKLQAVTKSSGTKTTVEDFPPVNIRDVMAMQDKYKKELLAKYPHLENPVYAPKVDELAETVVKGRMLSNDFLVSDHKTLERLSKIRESLNKQVSDLMDFLEISPKLLITKQRETDKGDVGSLVAELESYGEIWQDYERLDALRELLQKFHQLNSRRPDGTPQLNDWELWHMTRNRPVRFTCQCGRHYTLLGGFTPEEIEEALKQAYEVYGFGLRPIEGDEYEDSGVINTELLGSQSVPSAPDRITNPDDEDITSN